MNPDHVMKTMHVNYHAFKYHLLTANAKTSISTNVFVRLFFRVGIDDL